MPEGPAANIAKLRGPKGPPLPPVLFLVCLGLGALLEFLKPLPFGPAAAWIKVVPLLLLGAAATLTLSAIATIQRAATPLHPTAQPSALVMSGPFRYTRNPIYLGLLLALPAFAVVFDTLWLVLAMPVLMALLRVLVIPREERALTAAFGHEYEAYRRRVRRWL